VRGFLRRRRIESTRKGEEGVVILLVAMVLLFIVAAMAALAIDLVTFYTARSEAQQAADGGALAGARALANSGMTSDAANTALSDAAKPIAITVALQVASHNNVGGRTLNGGVNCSQEICVSFNDGDASFGTNPRVTVQVNRTDLPTFFARIWGRNIVAVRATATAEAYNPSGADALNPPATRIAPTCVKPWVLPNIDPRNGNQIFDKTTGAIQNPPLLGDPTVPFSARCDVDCTPAANPPNKWQFYAGDQLSFPAPTQSLPTCNVALDDYQTSIAGCVQTPISCNGPIYLDLNSYPLRNTHTAHAVNCLTHTLADKGDSIDAASGNPPFQFIGGLDNPVAGAQGANILVSDSLVTVPVYDSSVPLDTSVQVIGFVQLFLNYDGTKAPPGNGKINTRVVNLVGCGTSATGQAVLGNGASAVPVRLITQ
jgi:Flp pilus assembly protein TadG